MVSEDSNITGNSADGVPANEPERRITVRRAPRFVPFMVLGGLLGIVVAAFVAFGLPADPEFDAGAVFGFFTVAFAAGGVILGCIVALVLDRMSFRRREHAIVEAVEEEPGED